MRSFILLRRIILISVVAMIHPGFVLAQSAPAAGKPCSAPEASQFDFWLGDWELTWPGGQGGVPEGKQGRATNHIEKILGSCVIQENFASANGGFTGRSWSVYLPQQQEWRQTRVDNSGSYLLFRGRFDDGKMELRTEPTIRNGKEVVFRMVFRDISKKHFNWDWQRSADNGQTWTDVWNIHYQRKN